MGTRRRKATAKLCDERRTFALAPSTDVTLTCGLMPGHVRPLHYTSDKRDGVTIVYMWRTAL